MKRNVFDLFASGSDPVFVVDLTEEDESDSQTLSTFPSSLLNETIPETQDENSCSSYSNIKKERSFFSDFGPITLVDSVNSSNEIHENSNRSSDVSTKKFSKAEYDTCNKVNCILDNIKKVDETLVDTLHSVNQKNTLCDPLNGCLEKYETASEKCVSDCFNDTSDSVLSSLLHSTIEIDCCPDFLNEFSEVWTFNQAKSTSNIEHPDIFTTLEEKYKKNSCPKLAECLSNSCVDISSNPEDEENFHFSKLRQKLPSRLAFSLQEPVVPENTLYQANADSYPANIKVDPPFLQKIGKSHSVLTKAKARVSQNVNSVKKKKSNNGDSNSSIIDNSATCHRVKGGHIPLRPLKVVLSKLSITSEDLERDPKSRSRLIKEIENSSGYVAEKRSMGQSREQKALESLIKRISKTESVDKGSSSENVSPKSESSRSKIYNYPKGNEALIAGVKDLRWETKRRTSKRKSEFEDPEQNLKSKISRQFQYSKFAETCPTKSAVNNIRQKYKSHKRGRKKKKVSQKIPLTISNCADLPEEFYDRHNLLPQVFGVLKQGRDISGRNALHIAASLGHKASVKTVLKEQPHLINERDDDGRTPLHFAVTKNSPNVIYALLKAGAQPNAASMDVGKRPIHEALISNASLDIVKLLIEKGADPWYDLYSGESVFHLAKNEAIKSYLASFMMPPSDNRLEFDLRSQKKLWVVSLKSKSDDNEKLKQYLLASAVAECVGISLNVFLNRYSFIATIYTISREDMESRIILDYNVKKDAIKEILSAESVSLEANIILVEYNDRARDILNSSRMTVSESEAAWEDKQIASNCTAKEEDFEISSCSSRDSAKTLPMSQSETHKEVVIDYSSSRSIRSKRYKKPEEIKAKEIPQEPSVRKSYHPIMLLKTILEFSKRCTINVKNLFGMICKDLQKIQMNKYCRKSTRIKYDADCKELIDVMKKLVTSLQNFCRHIVYYCESTSYLGSLTKSICEEFSSHQRFCSFIEKFNHHLNLVNIYRDNILYATSYLGCLSWKEMQSDISFTQFTHRLKYFQSALSENKLLLLESEQYMRCHIYSILSTVYGFSTQSKIDQINLITIPKPMVPNSLSSNSSLNRSRQSAISAFSTTELRREFTPRQTNYKTIPQTSCIKIASTSTSHNVSLSHPSDIQSAAAQILNTIPTISYHPEIISLDPLPVVVPRRDMTELSARWNRRELFQASPPVQQQQRSALNIINSVKQSANSSLSQLQTSNRLCSLVPPNNHIVTTDTPATFSTPVTLTNTPLSVSVSTGLTHPTNCIPLKEPPLSVSRSSTMNAKSIPRILVRNKMSNGQLETSCESQDAPVRKNLIPSSLYSNKDASFNLHVNNLDSKCNSSVLKLDSPQLGNLQDRISKLQQKISTKQNSSSVNNSNLMKRMVVHDTDSRENALRQIMLSKSSSQASGSVSDICRITTKVLPRDDLKLQNNMQKFARRMPISNSQPIEVIDLDSD